MISLSISLSLYTYMYIYIYIHTLIHETTLSTFFHGPSTFGCALFVEAPGASTSCPWWPLVLFLHVA